MDCTGMFISPLDMRRVFNPELLARKGWAIIEGTDIDDQPEKLRYLVERNLRIDAPLINVVFIDPDTLVEYDEGEIPDSDYALAIVANAPFFARGTLQ